MNRTLLIATTLLLTLQSMAQDVELLHQEKPITGTKAELIRNARLKVKYVKDKALDPRPPAPSEQGWTLGTNLLSLLEEDAGPSLWVEYRFTKHLEVGLQGTWVAYNFLMADDFAHKGFRFQPDLKYYILPKHHSIMPFIGVGGVFTQVHYKAYTTKPEDGMSGGSNFSAGRTTIERKRLLGYAILFGFKKYLDGKEHRLAMEVYMGLGSKWKRFPGRSAERTAYIEDRINDNYSVIHSGIVDKFDYLKPNQYGYIPICVKFGYRF